MAKEEIPPATYTDRPTPINWTEQVHHPVTHTDKSLVPVTYLPIASPDAYFAIGLLEFAICHSITR